MLQDKKTETDAEKRKSILRRLIVDLNRDNPDLYYQPTSEVARLVRQLIATSSKLNADERKLMEKLSNRDLEILLSLH